MIHNTLYHTATRFAGVGGTHNICTLVEFYIACIILVHNINADNRVNLELVRQMANFDTFFYNYITELLHHLATINHVMSGVVQI